MLKPAKPSQNLRQFAENQRHYRIDKYPAGKWPCLACHGRGWVYDPKDSPDPNEGYRNVRQLTCEICKGSGEGPKAAVVEAYKAAIEAWKEKKIWYDYLVCQRKEALKKLTKDELAALRELGL